MGSPDFEGNQPSVQNDESGSGGVRWPRPRAVAFRVLLAYFVLYCLPFPLNIVPGGRLTDEWYQGAWEPVVKWTAEHLGLAAPTRPNGSGDTTFNYVQLLCCLVIAVVIANVWSAASRARAHPRLEELLRVYVRYVLATAMLSYGLAKVFLQQFPPISTERLLTTFGESSPMGLLWATMGYSPAYQVFGGVMETLGGLLLLFRRTATLGAIIVLGVMINVVMLNFCYDVPVKLYSSHLLAMSVLLLLPDLPRLIHVLVLGRAAVASHMRSLADSPGLVRLVLAAKGIVLALVGYSLALEIVMEGPPEGDGEIVTGPVGTYEVEEFSRNGEVALPLVTDGARWRRVNFTDYGLFAIRAMDGSHHRYRIIAQEPADTFVLVPLEDPRQRRALQAVPLDDGRIRLSMEIDGVELSASLRLIPVTDFYLLSRGFRWINEFPDSR